MQLRYALASAAAMHPPHETTPSPDQTPSANPPQIPTDQPQPSHLPEGFGYDPMSERRNKRILLPILITLGIIAIAVAYAVAGYIGVVVGVVLFALYYFIGWGPEVEAAKLRREENPFQDTKERPEEVIVEQKQEEKSAADRADSDEDSHPDDESIHFIPR